MKWYHGLQSCGQWISIKLSVNLKCYCSLQSRSQRIRYMYEVNSKLRCYQKVHSPSVDERTRYIHDFYIQLLCYLWWLRDWGSSIWKHILSVQVFWSLARNAIFSLYSDGLVTIFFSILWELFSGIVKHISSQNPCTNNLLSIRMILISYIIIFTVIIVTVICFNRYLSFKPFKWANFQSAKTRNCSNLCARWWTHTVSHMGKC